MPTSRRLRLTVPARRDLTDISDYTRKAWGDRQKRKYLQGIKTTMARLRDTPGIGNPRNDISPGLRAHPSGRHLIFYRDDGDWIDVLRILHQSRDPGSHFSKPDDPP